MLVVWLAGGRIQGHEGDALAISLTAKIARTGGSGAYTADVWFNVSLANPEFFRRTLTFRGSGEQSIALTQNVFIGPDWAANGCALNINPATDCNLYDVILLVHRLHKAV